MAEVIGSAGMLRPVTAFAAAQDRISVQALRNRGGLKWTYAGPDVLGAFVAEMDFGTAPEVEAALRDVIARRDYGYLPVAAVDGMARACAAWLQEQHGWDVPAERIRPTADVIRGLEAASPSFPGRAAR